MTSDRNYPPREDGTLIGRREKSNYYMNEYVDYHPPTRPPLSIESILSTRLSKLDAETNSVCPPMGDSLSQDLLESDDQRQGRFHVRR